MDGLESQLFENRGARDRSSAIGNVTLPMQNTISIVYPNDISIDNREDEKLAAPEGCVLKKLKRQTQIGVRLPESQGVTGDRLRGPKTNLDEKKRTKESQKS